MTESSREARELGELLDDLAATWRQPLDAAARSALIAYGLELRRWNQRINLIRFQGWRELVYRHLIDGFAAARYVPADAWDLIDVGAGAGIPGAVIAALRPDLSVVALEPIHKKHAFLRSLRRRMPITNFSPLASRLGEPSEESDFEGRFDVAVSRATWAPREWLERGRKLVKPSGRILAFEGVERVDLPAGAERHEYEADGRERAIIALPGES